MEYILQTRDMCGFCFLEDKEHLIKIENPYFLPILVFSFGGGIKGEALSLTRGSFRFPFSRGPRIFNQNL